MAGRNGVREQAVGMVLVAVPDGARSAAIARALAAEHLVPAMAFTAEVLMAFAGGHEFAATVVDPAVGGDVDPEALIGALRAASPAPIVVLGFVPGDGAHAVAAGIDGLLGADAPAADVVGTVITAIAHQGQGAEVVSCADLVVDVRNFEAWHGADRLDLTPTELRILAALVAGRGDLVTKQALQQAAWGSASPHDDNRLQAHIRRLRAKLDDESVGGVCRVRTVRGLGFRLEPGAAGPGPGSDIAGAHVHEATGTDHELSRSHR